ncbi:FtsX-like permease family protein [Actinomadura rudentiformis]|uniref:FtsX-like permease family protein n=1 Tax=Actinomadura rudentiformis TaxID=359158 RepID=A0A6H9YR75_9ACTN|nr:FtsX-like permease family protein [Actinomadura rudentiformis]KAB2342724.1 FtsX-like permease family protein [Actinomadura rudentiformis]
MVDPHQGRRDGARIMRGTGRPATLWRGLWFRRGMSAGLLLMAMVAVAAASIGPSYHDAAATFALRRTINQAPPAGQALHLTVLAKPARPPVPAELLDPSALEQNAASALGRHERLFQRHVGEILATGVFGKGNASELAWRDGVCAHLSFEAGRCFRLPTGPRVGKTRHTEVIVDRQTAAARGWRPGTRISTPLRDSTGATVGLTVVGVYTIRDPGEPYWYGRDADPTAQAETGTLFVDDSLFQFLDPRLPEEIGVMGRILMPVRADGLRSADREQLGQAVRDVAGFAEANKARLSFNSGLAKSLDEIEASLGTLQVPILVVTLQLVVLCWLLLFFLMTDIAQARAPDIALIKLRGLTGVRLLAFGLAEPLLLLLAALPLGVALGRVTARAMAAALFGSTVPMGMPPTVWLAAAGTVAGGVAAVVIASRAALTRPVTEQWRRTEGRRAARGWVPEAILLTLVAGGLAQIVGSGALASAGRQNAVSLVVPGLLAMGTALIAARLLPLACRALFARTRRNGGIGGFLALRQIARRPGGNRITISLATSLALVVFATASWSATRTNHREVALTRLGAPVVLTVSPPPGRWIADFVRQADPAGRSAGVMVTRRSEPGAPVTLAVDPGRFGAVAHWRSGFGDRSLDSMVRALPRRGVRPVVLRGDRLRLDLDVAELSVVGSEENASVQVRAEVVLPGRLRPVEVALGTISDPGRRSLTGTLPGCSRGCEIRRVFLTEPVTVRPRTIKGTLGVRGMWERTPSGWRPVDAGLDDPDRWRVYGVEDQDFMSTYGVEGGSGRGGLRVTFDTPLGLWQGMKPVAGPHESTAIVTTGVLEDETTKARIRGLNGERMAVTAPFTVRVLPAAAESGVVVDEAEARRAAGTIAEKWVEHQIWTTADAAPGIKDKVRAAGMTVHAERTLQQEIRDLGQQGPGLALTLLLAASVAAALLAAAGALLSLYASGRRRTYELAALGVAGARRRALRRSLLLEQLVVLGYGTFVGVGAGLLTVWLVLPSVPQFVHRPAAPKLTYAPDPLLLTAVVAAAVAVTLSGAWLMSRAIMARVRADQLREAPP